MVSRYRLRRYAGDPNARLRRSDVVSMAEELMRRRLEAQPCFDPIPPIELAAPPGESQPAFGLDEVEVASQIIGAALGAGNVENSDRERVVDEALAYARILIEKSGER